MRNISQLMLYTKQDGCVVEFIQPKMARLESSQAKKLTGNSLLRGSRLYSIESKFIEEMMCFQMQNTLGNMSRWLPQW